MSVSKLRIIHRDNIPQGGFAGIVEKQILINPKLMPFAKNRTDISQGFGGFLYLANGHFKAKDGADLHPHKDIDIVTVVLSGRLVHKGSLAEETIIPSPAVQVQRTGSGIVHAEVNPDDTTADFVQMWFAPPKQGLKPDYQTVSLEQNKMVTVLGGDDPKLFDNAMTVRVGNLAAKESLTIEKQFVCFVTEGSGTANQQPIKEGDLIEGDSVTINANSDLKLITAY